jgi:hypothetical protein
VRAGGEGNPPARPQCNLSRKGLEHLRPGEGVALHVSSARSHRHFIGQDH